MNTESLDSFKSVWNEPQANSPHAAEELLPALIQQWAARVRKLKRKFIIEFGLSALIYLGAISIIVQASSNHNSQLFGIKIVLLSLIFFVPVGISLYQSLSFLRQADLSKSVRSFVEESIERLKKSEKLYMQYSYLFSGFMVVLLITDEFFQSQALNLKIFAFAFIGISALMVKPYLKLTYSKERKHFEKIREEIEEKV